MSASACASEFAEVARRYCEMCDQGNVSEDSQAAMRDFLSVLASLCATAARLPDVEPSDRADVERPARPVRLPSFDGHDEYRECFNPIDMEAQPVTATLSDDLGDIYVEVKHGLCMLERGTEDDVRDALWNWRFSFESHWGEHATGALRALYWLLRTSTFEPSRDD